MAPIVYIYLFVRLQASDINFAIGITIICSFVFAMYNVFFNAHFGGSPGKLALGIRITKPDGSYIGWGEAWKRSSVDLVYTTLILYCNVFALVQVEADQYSALGFSDRSRLLQTYYPPWFSVADVLEQVWFWSELVVLLFNKRKRAIHDLIAGTVVIHKKFAEQTAPADRQ